MIQQLTAVVFFCYNRPKKTKESLTKILEFKGALPVFVFSDGDQKRLSAKVIEVRNILDECKHDIETTVLRKKNHGLAQNVISGISFVFNKGFDSVIVFEDDCVPDASFFPFVNDALKTLRFNRKVMHISGFGLPMKFKPLKGYYYSPYPCSWGWATWKDRWDKCDFEDNRYYRQVLNNRELRDQFDWAGKSFSHFLKLQQNGAINSWLIRWYVHIFKNNGVSLWPTDTRLKNIGFDGSGIHQVSFDRFNQSTNHKIKRVKFDNEIKLDPYTITHFKQFFMGPMIINKIKTVLYNLTGIFFEKPTNLPQKYKK
jgi:hypothetical protein